MKFNVKNPLYVVAFVAVVSAAFTAAIAVLQVATAERVERNERLRKVKALVQVFELGDVDRLAAAEIERLRESRIADVEITDPQTGEALTIYRAYESESARREGGTGGVTGVAVPIEGTGFWDRISGLLALTPDYSEITGVVFLEQSETPGLGARITESGFLQRFEPDAREQDGRPPLKATPPEDGKYIYVGGGEPSGEGDPRYGRSVDAITGATQTSIRVGALINDSLRRFRRAARDAGLIEGDASEGEDS